MCVCATLCVNAVTSQSVSVAGFVLAWLKKAASVVCVLVRAHPLPGGSISGGGDGELYLLMISLKIIQTKRIMQIIQREISSRASNTNTQQRNKQLYWSHNQSQFIHAV